MSIFFGSIPPALAVEFTFVHSLSEVDQALSFFQPLLCPFFFLVDTRSALLLPLIFFFLEGVCLFLLFFIHAARPGSSP